MTTGLTHHTAIRLQCIQNIPGWIGCWRQSELDAPDAFQILFSDENQIPACARNQFCSVVLDGFLQNRNELLMQLGEDVSPAINDVELILASYLRWGEESLQKIKGVF